MRYQTVSEVLLMYRSVMETSGGIFGILSLDALESALAQPYVTFDANELYSTIAEKADALGYSLVMNHAFVDGNKRIGHTAMESFLLFNGYEIDASTDEQEKVILNLAAGNLSRKEFVSWVSEHIKSTG